MTENQQENVAQVENKPSDKELNFRALEAKYRRELEQERAARLEAERIAQEAKKLHVEDEDDDEPYVAPKKLEKKLAKFGQSTQTEIQKAMEIAKDKAKEELKQEMWVEKNSDFNSVMSNQQLLQKFWEHDQELAETILQMPDTFERKKLVYKNIKALGIDRPPQQPSAIQQKIDANRQNPYYQPSGIGTAPYQQGGDFSPKGQEQAYNKMKELQARLRI